MIQKTVIKRKTVRERVPARVVSQTCELVNEPSQNAPTPKQVEMQSEVPQQNNG